MDYLNTSPADAGVESPYLPIVRLWILRVLVRRSDRLQSLFQDRERSKAIFRMLGVDTSDCGFGDVPKAEEVLRSQLAVAERRQRSFPLNTQLAGEIRRTAETLGLSDVERDILHFACLVRKCEPLATTLGALGGLSLGRLFQVVGLCLGFPLERVRAALERKRISTLVVAADGKSRAPAATLPGIWGNRVNISAIYFR